VTLGQHVTQFDGELEAMNIAMQLLVESGLSKTLLYSVIQRQQYDY